MSEDWLENMIKFFNDYKKKKLYAWLKGDGTLLSVPDDNYERIAALKPPVDASYVRLMEFVPKETKIKLLPPPKPRAGHYIRGGHAIGGFIPANIDDIHTEFARIFKKQYPVEVKIWVEDNKVFAEYMNVRCWVVKDDNLGMEVETNLKKQWSSWVTMIKMWNRDYHDVHLGDFRDGTEAVTEAFLAFVKFQIDEQNLDDYF